MLNGLLDEPTLLRDHIRRYTHSLTSQFVLGFRTMDKFDPDILLPVRQHPRSLHNAELRLFSKHYDTVRGKINTGTAQVGSEAVL